MSSAMNDVFEREYKPAAASTEKVEAKKTSAYQGWPLSALREKATEVMGDINEYESVIRYLITSRLNTDTKPTKLLTPLENGGKEFWIQAKVKPTNTIKIHTGQGFEDMRLDEAESWLNTKILSLQKELREIESLM